MRKDALAGSFSQEGTFSGRVTPREPGFKLRLNSVHIFDTLWYVLLCESEVELGPLTPCNFS